MEKDPQSKPGFNPLIAIFHFFGSLKLTVVLLVFSIFLVFFGTLEQVHWGIYRAQQLYFEQWIAIYPFREGGYSWIPQMGTWELHVPSIGFDFTMNAPIFPEWGIPLMGGWLLGSLLFINLLSAHFRYFMPSWKKSGIALIHGGLLMLLVAGVMSSWLQVEAQMAIREGDKTNYAQSFLYNEIAVIDRSNPDEDVVTAIPQRMMRNGAVIPLPDLGVELRMESFMKNARVLQNSQLPEAKKGTRGVSERMGVGAVQIDPKYGLQDVNTTTAIVEVYDTQRGESLGSWLVSNVLDERFPPQTFSVGGKTYELWLRFRRDYYPFYMELLDFTHDRYPGTEIPRNFSSLVNIIEDPTATNHRQALIYMNHPLRYDGKTFYQQSFGEGDTLSVLQVVRNPIWTLPYWAVLFVGLGMLFHFTMHLSKFIDKRKRKKAPGDSPAIESASGASA